MLKDSLKFILRAEGPALLLVVLGGAAASALLQSFSAGMLIASWCYLVYQLWAVVRLRLWQESPKKYVLPVASGLWGQVYEHAYSSYRQGRRRKKRLAEIVKEFRLSTNALPDAAIVLDDTGRVAWYNPAAGKMLGLSASRDVGEKVENLIGHGDFQRYYQADDQDLNGVEIPGLRNPEHTLWIRLVPYGHSQRLLVARDITERKRMEQSRRDFVSNASHELRTPLTVVSGYLELMLNEAAQGDTGLQAWQDPLKQMSRQSARMERIIIDMLKLAKLETSTSASDYELIDMPRLLRDAAHEAELMSEGRHTIHAEIDAELGLAGHPAEIQSVVQNLLTNAVRYTRDGGEIHLRWYQSASGERRIEVEDNGIGIAADELPRLTERFYRADVARSRETGGTGLGLAIVKHALERHGGHLEIRSREGKGSCFVCVFPAQYQLE